MTTIQETERRIAGCNKIAYVVAVFEHMQNVEENTAERRRLASLVRNIPSPSSEEVERYMSPLQKTVENCFKRMVDVTDAQLERMVRLLEENLGELEISSPPTLHYEQKVLEMTGKLEALNRQIGQVNSKDLFLEILALKCEIADFTEKTQGCVDFGNGEMDSLD